MKTTPALGPVALCTLISSDGKALVDSYCRYMHQQISHKGPMDGATARELGLEPLEGQNSWTLCNSKGRQWLHIIDLPGAAARDSLGTYGWLAMEVLVEDVDQLAANLQGSPFAILRPPADLDVSDNIRACQVRGPAGEILYLTQIRGAAPPFELPICEAPVDHLFIPVLSSPSRAQSLAQYSAISDTAGLTFDTKITVINQARDFEIDQRHRVATLQLAGCSLIEIDEIVGTETAPAEICAGVANIAFYCANKSGNGGSVLASGPLAGYSASAHTGHAGERYTLVYT